MAQLDSLNIPDPLYAQLQTLASEKNRSLQAEIVHLLQKGIETELARQNQAQLLAEINQSRWKPDRSVPDSVTFLREIRGYDD